MKEPTKREILSAVRQLTVLVRLGYPLGEGLKSMAGDTSPWLSKMARDMEGGDSLSVALSRQPRLFSPYFRSLVDAAASNPQPDKVLENLSHWLERSESLERKVGSVLLYPMILLAVLLVYVALSLAFILPETVAPLFSALHRDAPLPGLIQQLPWLALLPLLVLLIVGFSLLSGRTWGPMLALFPEVRGISGLASQALWARAMGSLLAAQVPVVEALEQSLPIVMDASLQQQLREAAKQARRGTSLSTALAGCPTLQPYLVWSLEGEDVAARMIEGADALDGEIEMRSQQQLRLMGPRAIVLLGVLSALALLVFWAPFYNFTAAIP